MKSEQKIVNPNENLRIPIWVTAEFFKDIVSKSEPESVAIENFTPVPAVPPGENYTSIMLRIHMDLKMKDGSLKPKSYILKTLLEDEVGRDIVSKMSLFPKEMKMYTEYIPAFEEYYKSIGWNIKFAPKCIFADYTDGCINFVFEDLKENNFVNIDRVKGCNMTHMKHVLTTLAQFHAASAVYQERNGDFPAGFQQGFVDMESDFQKNMFLVRSNEYKKAMLQWGLDNEEKYLKNFPTMEQYWNCCLSSLNQKSNNFNVLNHGDFWTSNIMFNYLATGELNKLLLVDYQFCKWGSPAEDLLLFITTSAAQDIRVKEFDYLISYYHEHLVACLKALDFKKPLPKLRDLHKDIFDQNNSFYAFLACFNHMALILLPNDKDSRLDTYFRDDEVGREFRLQAYTNPHFVEAMKQLFPFYCNRGLFNFSDYNCSDTQQQNLVK